MTSPELREFILHGREERNLEYKSSMAWSSSETKVKVTAVAMAMANIKDGGTFILGVEQDDEVFHAKGMAIGDFNSFAQDDVMEYVNGYADPYVELTVSPVRFEDGRQFIVIQIQAFDQLPVVCKKGGASPLRRGAMFTRPRRKYETTVVSSQTEMREIIDRAVDIQIRQLRERGLIQQGATEPPAVDARDLFEEQLGDL